MPQLRSLWRCPICGAGAHRAAFRSVTEPVSELGSHDMRPAASRFGTTIGEVVRCSACGHGSLRETPSTAGLDAVYEHVSDADTLSEEDGRVATALRDLTAVGSSVPGSRRRLLDIGCWTGSLLVVAEELGWEATGIEPSQWAVDEATARGLDVRQAVLGADDGLPAGGFQVVTCCDVLEHLVDPRAAADRIASLLEPGGILFATVPDAGSLLARVLGARWWSVLPMHVQYFTRGSLSELLRSAGFSMLDVTTHPKVFSRRYYGDRLGEFLPVVGSGLARWIGRSRGADSPFAPDFRDRIAAIARYDGPSAGHTGTRPGVHGAHG